MLPIYRVLSAALCSAVLVGCSSSLVTPYWSSDSSFAFSKSGTLIVSGQVPAGSSNYALLGQTEDQPSPGVLLGYFVPECKVEENFQSSIDSFEFSPLNEERNSNWRMSGSMEITGSVASLIDFDHIGKEYPQFLALRQQASLGMLESDFAASGSVVITAAVPSQDSLPSITIPVQTKPGILLGYIPPVIGFIPASNQVWGEIDRKTKTFTIHRGQSVIAEMPGQGDVPLNPGTYSVQHKLTRPKWYAPDSYFENRGLEVPADSQAPRARYRRGALGNYALYVTEDWAIHSSMEYSPEVGGFRVGQNDLASIYYLLPVGSSIKIK